MRPVISMIMQPFEYNIKFHELTGINSRVYSGSSALKGFNTRTVQPLSGLTSRIALAFIANIVQ